VIFNNNRKEDKKKLRSRQVLTSAQLSEHDLSACPLRPLVPKFIESAHKGQ